MAVVEVLPQHRILQAEDYHRVGPNRLPVDHVTRQTAVANVAMSSVLYVFDTNTAHVQMLEGGWGASDIYARGQNQFAVNLLLGRIVKPGEHFEIQHRTDFAYTQPPPPRFIRPTGFGGTEQLEVSVSFAASARPTSIMWAEWQGPQKDSPIVPGSEEPFELIPTEEGDHSQPWYVQKRAYDLAANQFVGFQWEWPPE